MKLFIFVFSIFTLVLVVISVLVDPKPGVDRLRASIVLAVVFSIPVGILYFTLGRFIVIDSSEGISKPTIFRRSQPSMIPFDNIESFSIVYLMEDDTKITGIMVHTTNGKSIRYLDYRTPGCSAKILELLQERGVSERVSGKKYFGSLEPRLVPLLRALSRGFNKLPSDSVFGGQTNVERENEGEHITVRIIHRNPHRLLFCVYVFLWRALAFRSLGCAYDRSDYICVCEAHDNQAGENEGLKYAKKHLLLEVSEGSQCPMNERYPQRITVRATDCYRTQLSFSGQS
jgi:hypothetical protein